MRNLNKERKVIRRLVIQNATDNVQKRAFVIAIEGNKGTGKHELKIGLINHVMSKGLTPITYKESEYDPSTSARREVQKRYSHSDKYGEQQLLSLITAPLF